MLLGITSATRVSTHTYVNPEIAVFHGWLFANEQLTTALLIATAIIIVSVYLVLHDQNMDQIPYKLIGELMTRISAEEWITLYETQMKK